MQFASDKHKQILKIYECLFIPNRPFVRSGHMVKNHTCRSRWTGTSCFLLQVPLCNLLPSLCDFVLCDQVLKRAYCTRKIIDYLLIYMKFDSTFYAVWNESTCSQPINMLKSVLHVHNIYHYPGNKGASEYIFISIAEYGGL